MSEFKKTCEECDEEFDSFIETICDECHHNHEKSVAETIDKLKKEAERYKQALEYIASKEKFIGKPKWDAEFVDVAKRALEDTL